MALPKLQSPQFTIEIPSTGKKIKYRPFTVKEEKILLMATQDRSADETGVAESIEQVLSNCIVTPGVKIDELTSYDVEFIFVNLRGKSVNNIIELTITDVDDDEPYDVSINIDDLQMTFNPERSNIIKLNDDVSITMTDPTYRTIINSRKNNGDGTDLIRMCIDKIIVGDDVNLMSDHTVAEQNEFIDTFSSKNMRDVEKYFTDMPVLKHDVTYTKKDGTVVTKTVEGAQTFFT